MEASPEGGQMSLMVNERMNGMRMMLPHLGPRMLTMMNLIIYLFFVVVVVSGGGNVSIVCRQRRALTKNIIIVSVSTR